MTTEELKIEVIRRLINGEFQADIATALCISRERVRQICTESSMWYKKKPFQKTKIEITAELVERIKRREITCKDAAASIGMSYEQLSRRLRQMGVPKIKQGKVAPDKPTGRMISTQIVLSEEEHEILDAICAEKGVSRSHAVRSIIRAYREEHP